jgi:hypothetical protein
MYIKSACQQCGQHIEFDDDHVGVSIKCPSCFENTILTAPERPQPGACVSKEISYQSEIPSKKATRSQLDYIRGLGGNPPPDLSVSEASNIIDQLLKSPDVAERKLAAREKRRQEAIERPQYPAHFLRQDCESAKQDLQEAERGSVSDAKSDLKNALNQRVEFWQDTFRVNLVEVSYFCEQTIKLYCEHGHRFKMPSEKRVQTILDILDSASSTWDIDGTISFFLTLEASFPELVRKNIDFEDLKNTKEMLKIDFRK